MSDSHVPGSVLGTVVVAIIIIIKDSTSLQERRRVYTGSRKTVIAWLTRRS